MTRRNLVYLTTALFLPALLVGCLKGQTDIQNSNTEVNRNGTVQTNQIQNSEVNTSIVQEDTTTLAFFYQTVGAFVSGASNIAVEIGETKNGVEVESLGLRAMEWSIGQGSTNPYGDPVISRLSDGQWAMTAWTGPEDTRGQGYLLYHEASCPIVDDAEVVAIGPSSAPGCSDTRTLTGGKTSQIFEAEGGNYVFHMINGEIYLAHLSDSTHSTKDLESICVLNTTAASLEELDYGESTRIIEKSGTNLLLSDTAVGQRADGTWVLFVKGISSDTGCEKGSVCELCARSIYRATSTDLINWSDLEEVMTQASIPEATVIDGTVWLYWQDFSDVCAAQDPSLGAVAPISAAFEESDSYTLSEPVRLTFPDEAFQTNSRLHYATNANPVALPDATAQQAFEACVQE